MSAAEPREHERTVDDGPDLSPEERRLTIQVLDSEYRMLMSAVSAAWSASLVRTTIFLGVLSAAGVALGFAGQGGVGGDAFNALALVVLPLLLFLGVATFVRLVQLQREALVYITGMNRVRHFFSRARHIASRTSCCVRTTTRMGSTAAWARASPADRRASACSTWPCRRRASSAWSRARWRAPSVGWRSWAPWGWAPRGSSPSAPSWPQSAPCSS